MMSDEHIVTCKRHRLDLMDDYLASIGQKRKPIPNDSSCLFRAVSEQIFSTQTHHLKVREACVLYMKENRELFEHFIDSPFDEYLERMSSPREWGDQLEICAISRLYRRDFYIYGQPGHAAKNVTENDYSKRIYLCHSGQKHYDCVYPAQHFTTVAICQSVLYSMLFENVLGMSKKDEEKSIETFRMLSCPTRNDRTQKDVKTRETFPLPSVYEPSIGSFSENIPLEEQEGLAFQLPISLDFVRSLDPSIYRNIDYDFWMSIKRRQQYVDFSVAEGLRYYVGDRCLVDLNIYSKPLNGHVQEVSPSHGPITVFIEALVEKHTIAVKSAKPVDMYNNSCRSEMWPARWRPRPFERNWNIQGDGKRFSTRNKQNWDKNREPARQGDVSHSKPIKHTSYTVPRFNQNQLQRSSSEASIDKASEEAGCSKNFATKQWNEFSPRHSLVGKKHNWDGGTDRRNGNVECPPTRMFQRMSINHDNYMEDSWNSSNEEVSENTTYRSGRYDWDKRSDNHSYHHQRHQDHQQPVGLQHLDEKSSAPGCSYWVRDQERPHSHDRRRRNGRSEWSNSRHYSSQRAESLSSAGSSTTLGPSHHTPSRQQNLNSSPNVHQGSRRVTQLRGTGLSQNFERSRGHAFVPYEARSCAVSPPESVYVPPTLSSGPVPQIRAYSPYTGSFTLYDCEGKEVTMIDDKNPFQYFYNLGVEYYRQMNANPPRPVPVVLSGTTPPNPYAQMVQTPILYPQPMSYVPPVNAPCLPPQVAQQHPGNAFPPVPHYHPTPSVGSSGAVIHPPRLLVHIPPPQHVGVQANSSGHDSQEDSEVPVTSSPRHLIHGASSSHIVIPQTTSSAPIAPNYSGIAIPFQAGSYLQPVLPQPGIMQFPFAPPVYDSSSSVMRPPSCPTSTPQQRSPFFM